MGRYGRLEILEVKEESFTEPLSDKEIQEILRREGERILKELKPRSFVVVLDRGGRALSSEELAEEFQRVALGGTNELVFVLLLRGLGWPSLLALFVALVFAAGQTFVLSRFWAFRR